MRSTSPPPLAVQLPLTAQNPCTQHPCLQGCSAAHRGLRGATGQRAAQKQRSGYLWGCVIFLILACSMALMACNLEASGSASRKQLEAGKVIVMTHAFGFVGPRRPPVFIADQTRDFQTFQDRICDAYRADGRLDLGSLLGQHKDVRGTSVWTQNVAEQSAALGHKVYVMTLHTGQECAAPNRPAATQPEVHDYQVPGGGVVHYVRLPLSREAIEGIERKRQDHAAASDDAESQLLAELAPWDKYAGVWRGPALGRAAAAYLKAQGIVPDVVVGNHIAGALMAESLVDELGTACGGTQASPATFYIPHSMHFARNPPEGVTPFDHQHRREQEVRLFGSAERLVVLSSSDNQLLQDGATKVPAGRISQLRFQAAADSLIFNQELSSLDNQEDQSPPLNNRDALRAWAQTQERRIQAIRSGYWSRLVTTLTSSGQFIRTEYQSPKPYITMWAGLDPRKGFLNFATTARDLGSTIPQQALAIAFGGSGAIPTQLQFLKSSLENAGAVLSPSPTSFEVGQYAKLSAASIVANKKEPFGIAALEALAAGPAIISTGMGATEPLLNAAKKGHRVLYVGPEKEPLFEWGDSGGAQSLRMTPEALQQSGYDGLDVIPAEPVMQAQDAELETYCQRLADATFLLVDPVNTNRGDERIGAQKRHALSAAARLVFACPVEARMMAARGADYLMNEAKLTWPEVAKGFLDEVVAPALGAR